METENITSWKITITDNEESDITKASKEYHIKENSEKGALIQALLEFSEGEQLWLAWIDELFKMEELEEIIENLALHNIEILID